MHKTVLGVQPLYDIFTIGWMTIRYNLMNSRGSNNLRRLHAVRYNIHGVDAVRYNIHGVDAV